MLKHNRCSVGNMKVYNSLLYPQVDLEWKRAHEGNRCETFDELYAVQVLLKASPTLHYINTHRPNTE